MGQGWRTILLLFRATDCWHDPGCRFWPVESSALQKMSRHSLADARGPGPGPVSKGSNPTGGADEVTSFGGIVGRRSHKDVRSGHGNTASRFVGEQHKERAEGKGHQNPEEMVRLEQLSKELDVSPHLQERHVGTGIVLVGRCQNS